MNSRGKMDGERFLGDQEKRIMPQQRRLSRKWRDVFRRWRIERVLSPKRESRLVLQWDGKILPSRNGGREKSTDSFERLTTTSLEKGLYDFRK